ncbi:hypothetical protein GC169_13400 [bacterium]|nr:hypothetical protein [bacterium]
MKRRFLPALIVAGFAIFASGAAMADASWPALFRKAAESAGPVGIAAYDFSVETQSEEPSVLKGRFDGTRPKGDRVTISKAEGGRERDPKKVDERMEETFDGDIWCDSLLTRADGPVVETGASPLGRIFAFTPKPDDDADGTERKMYKQLKATAVIDEKTGAVKSFSAILPQPYKPAIIAKIEKLEIGIVCDVASNGRTYISRMTTQIAGSAVGRSFKATSVQSISNLKVGG